MNFLKKIKAFVIKESTEKPQNLSKLPTSSDLPFESPEPKNSLTKNLKKINVVSISSGEQIQESFANPTPKKSSHLNSPFPIELKLSATNEPCKKSTKEVFSTQSIYSKDSKDSLTQKNECSLLEADLNYVDVQSLTPMEIKKIISAKMKVLDEYNDQVVAYRNSVHYKYWLFAFANF